MSDLPVWLQNFIMNKKKLFLSAVFSVWTITIFITGIYVSHRLNDRYDTGSANFAFAKSDFFKDLENKMIRIYRLSNENDILKRYGDYRLVIYSLKGADEKNSYGYTNHQALRNSLVVEFASHQLLHGEKAFGLELLEILAEYDANFKVNAWNKTRVENGRVIWEGDINKDYRPILLSDYIVDVKRWLDGKDAREDVIYERAFQHESRLRRFNNLKNAKSGLQD